MSASAIDNRLKLKPWLTYSGPVPDLDRIEKLRAFFGALAEAVAEAERPAEKLEMRLPFVAATIRRNALGANYCRDALQKIVDETGISRDQGKDWVEERIARTVGPWS
jgi:hypothetical protein